MKRRIVDLLTIVAGAIFLMVTLGVIIALGYLIGGNQ